jgi:disulfide bond formation protein DsbB
VLHATVAPIALPLALVVAAGIMAGSLYYSEWVGLLPCDLCWYQRIAAYPLVIIFAIGWWRRDSMVWWYATPLIGLGLAISTYHYLLQRFPSLETGWCSTTVPCSSAYFFRFGFISMPYMGISAFAAMATLWWIAKSNGGGDQGR